MMQAPSPWWCCRPSIPAGAALTDRTGRSGWNRLQSSPRPFQVLPGAGARGRHNVLLVALRALAKPFTVEAAGAQRIACYPQTAEDGSGIGPGSGGLAMIMVVSIAMYCQPGSPSAV